MSTAAKLGILIFALFALYAVYILTSNKGVGSFEKVRASGEINQSINVVVDRSKGFERDRNGNIVSFYARDKDGELAIVSPREPVSGEVARAEIVELFGHMHGNNFVALQVNIVEKVEE